jgi:hypothetical protein
MSTQVTLQFHDNQGTKDRHMGNSPLAPAPAARPQSVATLGGALTDQGAMALFTLLHAAPAPDALAWAYTLEEEQWATLLKIAANQRVRGYLYQHIQRRGDLARLKPEWQETLRHAYQKTTARNLVIYHYFGQIVDRLAAASIPLIVLKGAYLAANVYATQGEREMGDIDLLVSPSHLSNAVAVLLDLGYRPLGVYSETLSEDSKHLDRFVHTGHAVELHHRLSNPRRPLPIDVAEIWERAVAATIAVHPVQILSPEDQLLHLCIHGALQHQMDLDMRFLLDVSVFIDHAAAQLDWPVLVARAQRLGWARGLCLALTLARQLLGAQVPADVLVALSSADLPQSVLEAAVSKLFSPTRSHEESKREFATLWGEESAEFQAGHLLARIFLPRITLARVYKVAPESPWLPFYYLVRMVDLLQRYGRTGWQMWRRDPEIKAHVQRTRLLDRWLTTDDPPQ